MDQVKTAGRTGVKLQTVNLHVAVLEGAMGGREGKVVWGQKKWNIKGSGDWAPVIFMGFNDAAICFKYDFTFIPTFQWCLFTLLEHYWKRYISLLVW